MSKSKHPLLIGAHTSAAGGVHNALLEGQDIGATTIQLFTANQRRWISKPIPPEEILLWSEALASTGLSHIMSHDSYLINLGSPDPEMLHKSQGAFEQEVQRCLDLKIDYLNFHPGAATDGDPQACLDRIVESMLKFERMLAKGPTRLLLETTAGQGSAVGWKFEEVGYIIERTKHKLPVGVCIDTCHIFVAGYDIRTPQAWDHTLKEFDRAIGLKHLYAFHINDSVKGLGSRIDRHANLGEGAIGWDCFRFLMHDARTRDLPKYLETPDGPGVYAEEIAKLKSL
jgi:deoxyribonuclease-4